MPTINKYENRAGYYILARPSDTTGIITYKIHAFGYPLLREMDFDYKDEISWDTIKALKSLGLVYTDGSGTVAQDDFNPNQGDIQEVSLSPERAKQILQAAQEVLDPDEHQLEEAAAALGIEKEEIPVQRESSDGEVSLSDPNNLSSSDSDATDESFISESTSPDRIEENETYSGVIDRISNSGNGIIELKRGHINLGTSDKIAVGQEVRFRVIEDHFAKVIKILDESTDSAKTSSSTETHSSSNSSSLSTELKNHITGRERNFLKRL